MTRLYDIAVNLTDPMFQGIYRNKQIHTSDFKAMLNRAKSNGISRILVTGTSLSDSLDAINLAKQHPDFLYTTVGCHPTRANEFLKDPESYSKELISLVKNNSNIVRAIGECGLDYDRLEFCDKSVQMLYFTNQLEIAHELKMPLFLHSRGTNGDFVATLEKYNHLFEFGGVVHSFDGDEEEMRSILKHNLFIGINGCSLKTLDNLNVVTKIPLDRLLVETDAPWCEIKPTHAGFKHIKILYESRKKEKWDEEYLVKGRNEPCNVVQVVEVIAALKGITVKEVADCSYENSMRLFHSK